MARRLQLPSGTSRGQGSTTATLPPAPRGQQGPSLPLEPWPPLPWEVERGRAPPHPCLDSQHTPPGPLSYFLLSSLPGKGRHPSPELGLECSGAPCAGLCGSRRGCGHHQGMPGPDQAATGLCPQTQRKGWQTVKRAKRELKEERMRYTSLEGIFLRLQEF